VYLLESARTQFEAIVGAAEQTASRAGFAIRFPNKLRCPHCRKMLRYKDRAAGMSLRCPNPICGAPIIIPSLDERFWQAVNQINRGEDQ
jgi:phage FluMu protein Com